MATIFSRWDLPYLYHFMPDVGLTAINVSTALETMKQHLPIQLLLTMDAWFGSLEWMPSNSDLPVTSCISQQRLSHVWNILTYTLKYGQCRVFTINGFIVVFLLVALVQFFLCTVYHFLSCWLDLASQFIQQTR